MSDAIRVMIEAGKKKRVVACAFDWPGWDRSAKTEEDALRVLDAYRPRYAKIAALAGLAGEFGAAGELSVVERIEGNGMTDYYGVSGRSAAPEHEPMSKAACERKIALLRASWTYFDDVASRVSAELQKGPRGGGRDRETIIRHIIGTEILENGKKGRGAVVDGRLAGSRRHERPSRGALRRDPRVQRPRPVRRELVDGPVPDPALGLAHARPRVGDGGPGPVLTPSATTGTPGRPLTRSTRSPARHAEEGIEWPAPPQAEVCPWRSSWPS